MANNTVLNVLWLAAVPLTVPVCVATETLAPTLLPTNFEPPSVNAMQAPVSGPAQRLPAPASKTEPMPQPPPFIAAPHRLAGPTAHASNATDVRDTAPGVDGARRFAAELGGRDAELYRVKSSSVPSEMEADD